MGALEISLSAAQIKLDAYTGLLDGGNIKIYEGAKPADCDTAIGAQTLLATLTFGTPAFGAATDDNPGAVAAANAIGGEDAAVAEGTAQFVRFETSGGAVVGQGTVTATGGGGLLEVASTTIALGVAVNITSCNLRELES